MKNWRVLLLALLPYGAMATSELPAGQQLYQNQELTSPDGYYRLLLQGGDGNLVAYRSGMTVRWTSNIRGGVRAVMQTDGNLVVYDASSIPIWNSNTAGNSGAKLVLQNDGNVVIYRVDGIPIWDIASDPAFFDAPPGTLRSGESLHIGTSIHSAPNKQFLLAMQADGNLVYYNTSTGAAIWSSNTGSGVRAVMETDGNFALLNAAGVRIWQSNTSGRPGSILSAQDDGNLVVYDVNRYPIAPRWHLWAGSGGASPPGGTSSEQGRYPMLNVLPLGSGPTGVPNFGPALPTCSPICQYL